MNELINLLESSINKYFDTLSLVGYKDTKSLYNLLALVFIEEMMNNSLSYFITEDDYRCIINFLYSVSGNCIIEFPKFENTNDYLGDINKEFVSRLTEDSLMRITEDSILRKV